MLLYIASAAIYSLYPVMVTQRKRATFGSVYTVHSTHTELCSGMKSIVGRVDIDCVSCIYNVYACNMPCTYMYMECIHGVLFFPSLH